MKRLITPVALAFVALAMLLPSTPAMASGSRAHKIVIQVSTNNPKTMNIALNNAANTDKYYKEQGEEVQIEIVAYGPGLNMLLAGKSPVEARIKSFGQNFDNIRFSACGNTLKKFTRKAGGKEPPLVKEAVLVTAGIVRIAELQEDGWAYIRP